MKTCYAYLALRNALLARKVGLRRPWALELLGTRGFLDFVCLLTNEDAS